jgi:hypothetical protein
MPRYFIVPRARGYAEDHLYDDPIRAELPFVPEHVATDTGLLDKNGDAIMRAANPIGFGADL